MPTANLNDIDIYFEQRGQGPRLLFINGSGATLAGIQPLIDLFAQHFDVVAHDQRGLGLTTVAEGPYTMADYAADAAAVAEYVGWDTYMVVGISFGGMVAQELAVTFASRVQRLALLCTSSGGEGGSSYPLHTLRDLPPSEASSINRQLMDTRFDDEWLAEHPGDAALLDIAERRNTEQKSDDVLRGERLQLEARSHHDVFDRLPVISCPTLVASGRFDGLAPAANGAAIAAQIPLAELRIYEGGHAFFAQDRRAFPDIIEFLAR